ncbi:MAG: hypothetical protein K8W52_30855 [Deltaproteobacteria bacterium]|nr:hypothetical protein [Deltaproteobacteria bacterium]
MLNRRLAALTTALTMCLATLAQGQPSATPPGPPAPAPSPAPAAPTPPDASETRPATPTPAPDRADYDDAFAAMLAGDLARAVALFDGVAARTGDGELAAAARELARLGREMQTRKIVLRGPSAAPVRGSLDDDRDEGRTSFVVTTTLYSIYAGVVLIDDANISDTRVGILTVTGTTALGLLASIYGTRGRTMTGPMGDAYTLGMIEGFANAGLLVSPAGLTGSTEKVQTTLLLSGAVGGAAGLAYGYHLKPTRGQVSFASSLSLLGIASTGLGFGVIQPDNLDGDTALAMMAGGLDLGLTAGLVLGRDLDWSPSRGRLVQLGALVGGLSGLAVGALITGGDANSDNDGRILAGAALAGVWSGFAVAVRTTRGMRADRRFGQAASMTQMTPMITRGGAGLTLTGQF